MKLTANEHRIIHKEWHGTLMAMMYDFRNSIKPACHQMDRKTTLAEFVEWSYEQSKKAGKK